MTTQTMLDVTLVNETNGYQFSNWQEEIDDTHKLFQALRREYGRCKSRVYIDTTDHTKAVGWYFEKRKEYDDCPDTYLQGAWVSLYTVTREEVDIDKL